MCQQSDNTMAPSSQDGIGSNHVLTLVKVQKNVRCSEFDSQRSLKLAALYEGLCVLSET